jgi:hypothetical protein
MPGALQLEVTGHAPSLEHALSAFAEASFDVAALLTLASNAKIDPPQVDRAYETTEGVTKRRFFQNLALATNPSERRARPLERSSALRMLGCLGGNSDRDRIVRASRHYWLALGHMQPGAEHLALAHLYMGVEALTKVALTQHMQRETMDAAGLADAWGLSSKERERLTHSLEVHARRECIFAGDTETYTRAKDASDGFEHGYLAFDEVWALASQVRTKTAQHLRNALLVAAFHPGPVPETLLATGLNYPAHVGGDKHELWADIVGRPGHPGPSASEHPGLVVTPLPERVSKEPGSTFVVEKRGRLDVRLATGYGIENRRFVVESGRLDELGSDALPISHTITKEPPLE